MACFHLLKEHVCAIGLLRDHFPKGTDLTIYSEKELKKVQRELNERPLKVLDGFSPAQVFNRMIIQQINKSKFLLFLYKRCISNLKPPIAYQKHPKTKCRQKKLLAK